MVASIRQILTDAASSRPDKIWLVAPETEKSFSWQETHHRGRGAGPRGRQGRAARAACPARAARLQDGTPGRAGASCSQSWRSGDDDRTDCGCGLGGLRVQELRPAGRAPSRGPWTPSVRGDSVPPQQLALVSHTRGKNSQRVSARGGASKNRRKFCSQHPRELEYHVATPPPAHSPPLGWLVGGVAPHKGVRKLVGWVPIGRTPMHVY